MKIRDPMSLRQPVWQIYLRADNFSTAFQKLYKSCRFSKTFYKLFVARLLGFSKVPNLAERWKNYRFSRTFKKLCVYPVLCCGKRLCALRGPFRHD